jgi:hypothetical protein
MWKFGVKPLVRDINSVHAALSNANRKIEELLTKKFTMYGKHHETASSVTTHFSGNSPATLGFFSYEGSTTRETTATWVYGVRKRLNPAYFPTFNVLQARTLAESLGLGLDATDIWEAVPYSFVLDWFIPIQTFLEQFGQGDPDSSWLVVDGAWFSEKKTTNGITSTVYSPLTSASVAVEETGVLADVGTYTATSYQRVAYTTLPSWIPNTYIPRPKLPNLGQSVTGIELVLQRVLRKLG